MAPTDFKVISEIVVACIQSIAILVGGGWAFWKFGIRREKEPRLEFDIDAIFLGVQAGRWVVEVSATLANKGSVRHQVSDATLNIRYLTADDPVKDSNNEKASLQTDFPNSIGRRKIWSSSYVDPGLTVRNSYLTSIPREATFIVVQCRFEYGESKFPAQRVLKVPAQEHALSEQKHESETQ